MKRSRFTAVAVASMLALSVAGVALAEDLNPGQVGAALSTFNQDCSDFETQPGEGEIGVHFVLTDPNSDEALLDAVFSTDSVTDVPDADKNSTTLHFYVIITGDGSTTVTSASTDIDGGNLNVSHVCAGPEPSFEESQEGETDAPTEPTTDALGGNGTSAPADGAWLLVVALGVLLGSIVVLTPARAKSRR